VASTQRTLLAANLPISFDGVVSPDGTTVAYWRQSGRAFAVDLVGLDGRSPRKLIAGLDPTWSADGSRLAVLTATGRIETIGADGSGEQSAGQVRNPAGRVIEPGLITSFAWAPDGESFLVSAFYTSSGNLVETVASTGRTLHVLSKKAIAFAAWSPDGAQAAFTETHSKTGEAAVVVNADGSGLHTAYTSLGLIDLAWSPDGTSIVTADGDRVRIVDADGTHPMVLAYPRREPPAKRSRMAATAITEPPPSRQANTDATTLPCVFRKARAMLATSHAPVRTRRERGTGGLACALFAQQRESEPRVARARPVTLRAYLERLLDAPARVVAGRVLVDEEVEGLRGGGAPVGAGEHGDVCGRPAEAGCDDGIQLLRGRIVRPVEGSGNGRAAVRGGDRDVGSARYV
jgi:hypothetical protein